MNKLVSKIAITVSAVAALLLPVLSPTLAGAAVPSIANNVCAGTSLDVNNAGIDCTGASTNTTLQNATTTIVNLLSLLVGILSTIMLAFGAYFGVVSSGGSETGKRAKNAVLYALVGLVIVAIAQVVVRVVLGKANTIG